MHTAILEDMACGCAIIATDVGAVKTMVSNENGWLIDSNNIKKGLNRAMVSAFTDKQILHKKKLSPMHRIKKTVHLGYHHS